MKKYKYIFWDMDGTVANTYEGVSNCLAYALEPYGIHLEGEQEIRKFIGPPFRLSFKNILDLTKEKRKKQLHVTGNVTFRLACTSVNCLMECARRFRHLKRRDMCR